ncbi:MAG TPA: tetratricopeptide repeat protein [Candidatus Peribacteraceae bacterium]|nr:tetratricopeptide repeat protein [Candidatus Peribacteraceae bacterium]
MLIAFGACLKFGFAPVDDYHLIVQNLAIRDMSWDGWKQMFTMFDPELYIPLTFLSFKIEALIAGMNPLLFHLDNLLLHIANVLLAAWIITRLSGSRLAGWCAALIFAAHPLDAETVTWISARKDLLATLFTLLSMVFIMKSIDREDRRFWILSVVFFVLALLSKISVVLLPLFIIAMLLRERFTFKSASVMLAPYVVASVALGIIAVPGKGGVLTSTPPLDRIVLTGYALSLSIGHFFIPARLALYYVLPTINATTIIIALFPLLLIAAAVLLWKKLPLFSIGIAWFFVFILPTVLNIQTDVQSSGLTFASDRYLYLPMIGLLIALIGIIRMIRHLLDDIVARWSTMIATAIMLLIFIQLARAQVATWSDAETLFKHAIAVSPTSVEARVTLAEALKQENKLQDAFAVLKDGLAFSDDERLHLEAGTLYAAAGDVGNALQEFTKAQSMDPQSSVAYDGLAALQENAGDTSQAKRLYEKAVQLQPQDITAHLALAQLLLISNDASGAQHQLNDVLAIDPSNIDALNGLSDVFSQEGNAQQAAIYQRKASLLSLP